MKTLTSVLASMTAVCLASGCSHPEATELKSARPVKAQTVTIAASPSGVKYSAAIDAFEQVPLSFKASGYVDMLLRRPGADGRSRAAQPGDLVTRGTVLARVRESEYRERLSQGRSKVAEAEAGLEKARLDLERAKTLFAADSLIKPDLDAAQASFDSSQARLAGARAEVELAAASLGDTALTAPATGIILERRIEAGSLVGSGTVGFVIGDISAVKAKFGIPDSMIQSVRLGESIDLMAEAVANTTFAGTVTAIAPAADRESRVFDVEVTIPNRDGRLRPGMIGTVAIRPSAAAARDAGAGLPAIPLTAIVKSAGAAGGYAVFAIERRGDAEIARKRSVRLGDVIGNGIVVLNGLQTGERVIVSGATLVADGEVVRVIP